MDPKIPSHRDRLIQDKDLESYEKDNPCKFFLFQKTFFPSSSRSEALSGGRVADDCLDILALSPQAQRPDPAPLPNETDVLCNGVGSLTISEERKNVPG